MLINGIINQNKLNSKMLKLCVNNSLIGSCYPFFLSNNELSESSYYLYRIYSPSLSPELIPYISLEKISEKTRSNEPHEKGADLISVCLGKRASNEKACEFVQSILKREEEIVIKANTSNKFPLIEMANTNSPQKSLIVGLRDALRWRIYRFIPGRFIDVLWTPTKFVVFKINAEEQDAISLEPVAVYDNNDVNLTNPLNVNLNTIDYPKEKFSGKGKASDLNRLLKRLEWNSFERRELRVEKK